MNFGTYYITEAAKDMKGLALFVHEGPKESLYALYDPVTVKEALMEDKPIRRKDVMGGITIKDDIAEDAVEIDFVTAQKGFGPILYMLAMNFNKGGIRSNKKGVSDQAKSVLENFFRGKGKDKVDKIKLKNKTKWKEDYLNYKYTLKNKLSTSQPISLNKKVTESDPENEKKLLKALRRVTRGLIN